MRSINQIHNLDVLDQMHDGAVYLDELAHSMRDNSGPELEQQIAKLDKTIHFAIVDNHG